MKEGVLEQQGKIQQEWLRKPSKEVTFKLRPKR